VWNITAALGGAPRFGRGNFPLDVGNLPASVTVRLSPFNMATLQHFIFLERPKGSAEADGAGFAYTHTMDAAMSARVLRPWESTMRPSGTSTRAVRRPVRTGGARDRGQCL